MERDGFSRASHLMERDGFSRASQGSAYAMYSPE